MPVTAADVKKLRDATLAPMMECKAALEEADGDFEKAKDILRQKGQSVAAKKAGRSTAEGIAIVAVSEDKKTAVGLVIECETDFVARNAEFISTVEKMAAGALADFSPAAGEVITLGNDSMIGGQSLQTWVEGLVNVIRENIVCKKAVSVGAVEGAEFGGYNHHNKKHASLVEVAGTASGLAEIGLQVAIQSVAFPPKFLKREEVPQDVIDKEIEIETQRAVEEGKDAEVAKKIAAGRVQKEYYATQVLLEQPFYMESKQKTGDWVGQKAKELGGTADVRSFHRFSVGEGE